MAYYTAVAIGDTIKILIDILLLTFLINLIFFKDFRILLYKIKKVVLSHETNKTTQIQKILYNYFFID